MKKPKPISKARSGDVVYVDRGLYRHYGVYDNGSIIDISTENGDNSLNSKHTAFVRKRSLDSFLNGDPAFIDNSPGIHFRKKTLSRAREEIGTGQDSYDLVFNNCEHKAREWQTGQKQSKQVENALEQTVRIVCHIIDRLRGLHTR